METVCDDDRYLQGFLYFTGVNFLLTLVAAVLCVCFAPTAAGPGIPEIKAYLNGVDTPNMFGATTLIVKVDQLIVKFTSSYMKWKFLTKLYIGFNKDFVALVRVESCLYWWIESEEEFPQWVDFCSENDISNTNLPAHCH